jgi:hypothetical protein
VARIDGSAGALGAERESGGTSMSTEALLAKVRNLELAMESQRTIGIAIGLIAQRAGIGSDEAWQQLVGISQATNLKVREIARVLVDARNGRAQPTDAATLADVAARLVCDRSSARRDAARL